MRNYIESICVALMLCLFCQPILAKASNAPEYQSATLLASISESGYCGEVGDGSNLSWTLDSEGVLTVRGTGAMKNYNTYPSSERAPWTASSVKVAIIETGVTSIGDLAFFSCTNLATVSISRSVTRIGVEAFNGCSSLTSVNIPDGVNSIGYCAFAGCFSLTSITIPTSVTSFGDDAPQFLIGSPEGYGNTVFHWCNNLTDINYGGTVWKWRELCTAISLENGIVHCSDGDTRAAYGKCGDDINWYIQNDGTLLLDGTGSTYPYNIESGIGSTPWYNLRNQITYVRVQGTITSLNGVLFEDCQYLKGITLCASLESIRIEDWYSRWPSSIEYIITEANSKNYVAYGGVLYAKSGDDWWFYSGSYTENGKYCLVYYPPAMTQTSYVVRSETEVILDGAFTGNKYLESLELNEGLKSIPRLSYCSALKEIKIPSSITEIASSAFEGCTSLTDIEIPYGVTEIPSFAFYGCSSLSRLVLPTSVTTVSASAFWFCDSLNPIIIPASVNRIEGNDNLPDGATVDSDYHKDWYFEGSAPVVEAWDGSVMNLNGNMAYVRDYIYYPAGSSGWNELIQKFSRIKFFAYGDKPNTYTVIWLDGDESILDSATYLEGEREPVTEKIPRKEPENDYVYSFSSWDEGYVVGRVKTYTPIFRRISPSGGGGSGEIYIGSISCSGDNVTINISCNYPSATLFCGIYTNNGRMVSIASREVTGTHGYDFQFSGIQFDYVKAFLVDEDLHPLCESRKS